MTLAFRGFMRRINVIFTCGDAMSLIYADNDPLAPAGQQRGRAFSPGEILQSQLQPVSPRPGKDTPNEGWFSLGAPVGPHPAPNRRSDVLRVETLLGRAGDYDIGRTDGPTGWWGSRAEGAVRTYQKRKGLKVDGLLNPGGPTIASLESDLADAFKGFPVPTPSEIDAHHDALKLGEPGLLTHKPPPLDITLPEGVAEGTQAANRRTARFLLGRASDDGLDQFVARDIQDNGEAGILRNRDLVLQINELDPKRAHSFAWGILSHLPRETARDFLGGEVPDVPPVGIRKEDWRRTLEVRKDDPDPAPRAEPYYPDKETGNRYMLLNDTGEGGGAGGDGGSGNDANEPASTQPPENGDGASNQPRANDQGATPPTTPVELPSVPPSLRGQSITPAEWKRGTDAISKLPDVSDKGKYVLGKIHGAEGGPKLNPAGGGPNGDKDAGAYGGITQQFLNDTKKRGDVPGLDKIKNPKDLSDDQLAQMQQAYLNHALRGVDGGMKGLDKIDNKDDAAALAHVIYHKGDTGGARLIQKAINQTTPDEKVATDGKMGNKTLDAFAKLANDPSKRDSLMNKLRVLWVGASKESGEKSMADYMTRGKW